MHHIIKKEDDGQKKEGGNALMTAVAVNRPMEQLLHTLMLANELLQPLETDQRSTKLVEDIASGTQLVRDLFGQEGTPPLLREFTASNAQVLVEYSALLYPILVDMSVTIVNEVRQVRLLYTQRMRTRTWNIYVYACILSFEMVLRRSVIDI